MNYQKLMPLILIGFTQACSVSSPSVSESAPVSTKPNPAPTTKSETVRQSNEPTIETQTTERDYSLGELQSKRANLPDFCAPDEYETFFEKFVWGKDEQGKDIRATYTTDRIEVRDYDNPDQVLEVLRRQDDEFSIDLRDYRWVQLVPSSVDDSPYTRLKLDVKRLNEATFRVDYIQAQYKYTGDVTGTESEELVQTYGNPGAYIFQHRNGCWNLTQKLRSTKPN
jgi:hypothetical protein